MRERAEPGAVLDPSELRFRLDSVPAGAWVPFVVCFAGMAYVVAWERDHAEAMAVLFGLGALGGVVALALPWERIVRSRWREAYFAAWSLINLALLVSVAALDGGGDSPLATLLAVPVVFAAISYPRRLVAAISATAVLAYILLAVLTDTPGGQTLIYSTMLA